MTRSMKRSNAEFGALGEAHAASYLERRGYTILGRNVRIEGVEIDLIARRSRILVFVEVKSRQTKSHGSPEEAVDRRKQARLVRGASAWLHSERRAGHRLRMIHRFRFDVIACELDSRFPKEEWLIRHLKGAFDAGGLG